MRINTVKVLTLLILKAVSTQAQGRHGVRYREREGQHSRIMNTAWIAGIF